MIEPLRFEFEVACDAAHAFRTWTSRATAWWPRSHTVARDQVAEIVFEPHIGGRVYERTRSGLENEWGAVTAWDPPRRLAYLWHIATDRAHATDVEIRFVRIGPAATRVVIEHGGWDRLGAERGQAWRDENQGGWRGVLPDYVTKCASLTEASTGRT